MTFGNDKTVDITFFDSKKWLHCRTKEKIGKNIQDEIHIHITFRDIFNAQCSFNSNVIRRSQ